MIIGLLVLFSLMNFTASFTPPKIIYGGWTPILPGHPFFPRKYFEQYRKPQYVPHSSQFSSSPRAPNIQNGNHYAPQEPHGNYGNSEHPRETYQSHSIGYNSHYNKPIINQKNIFSYYPPQSSYDKPPTDENLAYKPVYLEVPRKPFEILENPHKVVPYILPSLKDLIPKDLNIENYGKEQTYLKITPIGKVDPHAVHQIGHINLEKIKYIPDLHGKEEYKSGHDSSVPVSLKNHEHALYSHSPHSSPHQDESNYGFINHNHVHKSEPHNIHDIMNNFRGTDFPHPAGRHGGSNHNGHINGNHHDSVSYQSEKVVSPIKTSSAYFVKDPDYRNSAYTIDSSLLPHSKTYLPNTEFNQETKHISSDGEYLETPKKLILPITGSSSTSNDFKLLGSSEKSYNPSKAHYLLSNYKPHLLPGTYHFDHYPKNPSTIYKEAKHSYLPKLIDSYIPKNSKLKKVYQNPGILTKIQGNPAVVERDVTIIHVPIDTPTHYSNDGSSYSDHGTVMYSSASTPISVETKNLHKSNDNKHSNHFISNNTLSHHDYDKHIISEPINNENDEYIFVGTRGIRGDEVHSIANPSSADDTLHLPKESNKRKNFFHAYYAAADHVPPKGYMKMTVDEFHKLFHNAEIQYIKRDQGEVLRSRYKSKK
ncbi:uncharacterized protein CDAR_596251 [Caerostris darwini]|uniref:Uncharacterized protein n=1 Tax=Caerostris darwini TaxID=1538125 RepID=A0AAV4UXW0_9ARAC|nr:uncharacterized protein CDAR_596251 [Caerostris darwini]